MKSSAYDAMAQAYSHVMDELLGSGKEGELQAWLFKEIG